MLHIHTNAGTTPATRAEIARSTEPIGTVAQRYGISAETVRKLLKASVAGFSTAAHRSIVQSTPVAPRGLLLPDALSVEP